MRPRPGYTLLEVLLALAIAVLLMGALYTAVSYQLRLAQAGREVVAETTLARAILFNRIGKDIHAAVGLNDPARFRAAAKGGMGGGAGGGGAAAAGATTTPSAGSTGATTTPTTGTATPATGTTSATGATAQFQGSAVRLPLGVIGDASSLTLYISRVPEEVYPRSTDQQGQLTSDLRRVSYWLASEGGGLCRWEAMQVTSDDATALELPTGDEANYVIAPEVRSLEFEYFDGTTWLDSWDSTEPGPDGVTPLGSPRLIAVRIGVVRSGSDANGAEPELRYYRHVVPILTAGGAPAQPTETGSTP
jgi:prepilin-type N-terminal cleavage/methylation domain-containing protein